MSWHISLQACALEKHPGRSRPGPTPCERRTCSTLLDKPTWRTALSLSSIIVVGQPKIMHVMQLVITATKALPVNALMSKPHALRQRQALLVRRDHPHIDPLEPLRYESLPQQRPNRSRSHPASKMQV